MLRAGDYPPYVTNAHPPGTPSWVEVDVLFKKPRLVIEADGGRYHGTEWRREHDAYKRKLVEDAGYGVLVLTDEDGTDARKAQTEALIHGRLRACA